VRLAIHPPLPGSCRFWASADSPRLDLLAWISEPAEFAWRPSAVCLVYFSTRAHVVVSPPPSISGGNIRHKYEISGHWTQSQSFSSAACCNNPCNAPIAANSVYAAIQQILDLASYFRHCLQSVLDWPVCQSSHFRLLSFVVLSTNLHTAVFDQ